MEVPSVVTVGALLTIEGEGRYNGPDSEGGSRRIFSRIKAYVIYRVAASIVFCFGIDSLHRYLRAELCRRFTDDHHPCPDQRRVHDSCGV